MAKVEVIHDDAWDWEIAVVNGAKVAEGHSINLHDWANILDALGVEFETVKVDDIQQSEFYQ